MTGDRSLFIDFHEGNDLDQQITIENKMKLPILGSRIVNVTNGSLKNVLFVKGLGMNLISVFKITQARFEVVVTNNQVVIDRKDPSNLIAIERVDHKEFLFKFLGFVDDEHTLAHAFIAQTDYMTKLWHARLGHINYRKLQDMVRKDKIIGLTKNSAFEGVCDGCVVGKHH